MRVIVSCSIDSEEKRFLEEKKLSASELLQGSIQEAIRNHSLGEQERRQLEKSVQIWKGNYDKARDFIEAKGLFEDFIALDDARVD